MKARSNLIKILVDTFTAVAFFLFVVQTIFLYNYLSSFLSGNPDFSPSVILCPSLLAAVPGLFLSILSVLSISKSGTTSGRLQKRFFSEVFSSYWWNAESFQVFSGIVLVTEGLIVGVCLSSGYCLFLAISVAVLLIISISVKSLLLGQTFWLLKSLAYFLILSVLSFGAVTGFF